MALATPYNLNATAATTNKINLTWSNADSYTTIFIQRKVSGGTYSALTSVGGSTSAYSDTTCADGIKYYYKLRGWTSGEGFSDFCTEAYATTALKVPTGLAGSAASNTSIALTWTDQSSSETGFEVYQNSSKITTTAAEAESYTKTGLTMGTTYSYKIRAVNAATNSAYTSTINVLCLLPPSAPSGLVLTVVSESSIKLDWTDNSNNEYRFKIYRSLDGSSYDYIGYVNANITTYTDTGLDVDTLYYYKVRAINDAGVSSYCTAASATTASGVTLSAPTDMTAVSLTGTKVEVNFTNNSIGEEYHCIERDAVEVSRVTTGTTYYLDDGLTEGTEYSYKVRDVAGDTYGDYGSSVSVTTPKSFGWIAWGDGSTAESSALSALVSEQSRASATIELATTETTHDTTRFSHEFTATSSAAAREIGVFDASSAGNMLGRKVLAAGVDVAEGSVFIASYDCIVRDSGCGG